MKYKPYRYLLYLGLRFLEGLVNALPREAALFFARTVGRVAFLSARRERHRTLLHLNGVFEGKKSSGEIRKLGEQVFTHWAQAAVEVLRFPKLNLEEINRLVEKGNGMALIDRALSKGKGLILLTAHLGNWELLGAWVLLNGYEGTVVGKRIYYEKFNEVLIRLRQCFGLKTLYQDESPKKLLEVLNRNHILGILADQDVDQLDGIFVPFLGRSAYTLTAPVRLALASGAPILPTFLVCEGNRYRLLVEEPIYVEMSGTREETVRKYTEQWSRIVEEKIQTYPDQWVWMHRRWKTQPLAEGNNASEIVIARRPAGPTKQSPSTEIASASLGTLPRNDGNGYLFETGKGLLP